MSHDPYSNEYLDEIMTNYETFRTVQIRKAGVRRVVSPEVLNALRLTHTLDKVTGNMVVQLTTMVASDRLLSREQEAVAHFPANPWQHFKQRFMPKWFVTRYPVRTSDVTITTHVDVDGMYPKANVPINVEPLGPMSFVETGRMNVQIDPSFPGTVDTPHVHYQEMRKLRDDIPHKCPRCEHVGFLPMDRP